MLHRLGLIALCLLLTQAAATAQDWPARPIRAIRPYGFAAAASRPIRDRALPEATASRQPWLPQPHRGPSGSTIMCPSSAPMPVGPR